MVSRKYVDMYCPFCGKKKVCECSSRIEGLYQCKACRKYFVVELVGE